MSIDHIFIFTPDNGQVADELVDFGLTEGSGRIHVGQGTTNRKFYFENFYLEVLWVHNEKEFRSELIEPTGLCQRADFRNRNVSSTGLCLVNSAETDKPFERAFKYQPDYFPKGKAIEILNNEATPSIPWTFRLPFEGQVKNESEPTNHSIGLSKLTKATFEFTDKNADDFLKHLESEQQLCFVESDRIWLTLTFDDQAKKKSCVFEKLRLTINY